LAALNQADTVYLSIFVLSELWAGFYGVSKQRENHAILQRFMDKPNVTVLTADASTATIDVHFESIIGLVLYPL